MEILKMNVFRLKIVLFLLIIFALCPQGYSQDPAEQDSLTLIALYESTNGANWTNNTGWSNPEQRLDTWHGVSVNVITRRVTQLSLGSNNLSGPLPDAIGNLTEMDRLFLDNNNITGPLPTTIGALTKLTYFQFWNTQISGTIPVEITQLKSLRNIYMSNSMLEGPIPAGLDSLVNLEVLSFGGNNLSGPIPAELGNLPNLNSLYLEENQLSGPIPPELGNLSQLNTLWLQDNQLSGTIPNELYFLPKLDHLRLQNNLLKGDIPADIVNLTSLNTLQIQQNDFTSFPDISALAPMSTLDLSENKLDFRHIEPNVGVASTFQYYPQDSLGETIDRLVYVGDVIQLETSAGGNSTLYQWKKFGANIDIPSADSVLLISPVTIGDAGIYTCEITNTLAPLLVLYTRPITVRVEYTPRQLDSLALVDLYNSTGGPLWSTNTGWLTDADIDGWWGISTLNGRVKQINLGVNNLTGTLPASIADLDKLANLLLSNNSIKGGIPPEIGNMFNLDNIWINGNNLDQAIPDEITNLTNLRALHLEYNQIPGTIPANIGNMTQLEVLALAHNQLTGNIPASITNLQHLSSLWLTNNDLSGPLPENIGDITTLKSISLDMNSLDGPIPSSIGKLLMLESFDITSNDFKGAVPDSITKLLLLQELSVADNRLTDLPDLSPMSENLAELKIEVNNFTFEDIEPNMTVANSTFTYIPQDSVGEIRDTTVVSGSSLTISAGVGGENNQYLWYKNGISLTAETGANLVLDPVDESRTGSYHCEVTNTVVTGLSIYTRPVRVWIIGAPLVTTDPATNISTSSAMLNGKVNPSGLTTTVTFYFSTDQSTWTPITATQSPLEESGEQLVSATLTTLSENTAHWFYVKATNSQGSKTGATLSFTTLSLATAPTVSTNNPSSISSTSAVLSGTVNPNDLSTDAYFQFSDSVSVTIDQSTPLSGTDDINVTGTATGLSPGTNYQVRLVATNSSGRTNGNWVNFQTTAATPGPTAVTLKADQVSENGARLRGLVNPNGLETNVEFEWGTTTAYGNSVVAVQSPVSGTTELSVNVAIIGLTANRTYHYRVKANNTQGTATGSDQSFLTAFAPVVLNGPSNGSNNISIKPTFTWVDVSGAPGYWLQVSDNATLSNIIVDANALQSNSFTPSSTLEFQTTYYWRVTVDGGGIPENWSETWLFTTAAYPTDIPIATTFTFPSNDRNDQYSATDYRLIGLPGDPKLDLTDIFGAAVKEKWIAYWDNGQSIDYLVEYNNSSNFKFETGKAFWIIYNGSLQINRQVSSAPINSEKEVEITLHASWNLITNPFDSNIDWLLVQSLNGISQPLYRFNGSFSTTNTMIHYEGYYFFNESGLDKLRIPMSAGQLKPVVRDGLGWKVGIALTTGKWEDTSARIGYAEDAKKDLDRFDYRKPRAVGAIPSVSFLRPEWDETFPVFASDIRPRIDGMEVWDFQVYAPYQNRSILSFPGLEDVPDDYAVYLIDRTRMVSVDLRQEATYAFFTAPDVSEFELVIGEAAEVMDKVSQVLPATFALDQNYPNPFNPSTTITIQLPEKSGVNLKIYNLLGQEMLEVYDGSLAAGRHFFTWNGVNRAGQKLSSGVYIYVMTTNNGKRFAKKMVMIK